jgi:hypothetical protein
LSKIKLKKCTSLVLLHNPFATFTNSLYFIVLKNIPDYIQPNEKTGEVCTVKECKMLKPVAFTFLPRETEGTLVTDAIYRPDLEYG